MVERRAGMVEMGDWREEGIEGMLCEREENR